MFRKFCGCIAIGLFPFAAGVRADVIGLAQLRSFDPTLTGTGVSVVHAEGDVDGPPNPPRFEVSPIVVNQPASLFTYISANGTVAGSGPTNAAGTESGHADTVADSPWARNR